MQRLKHVITSIIIGANRKLTQREVEKAVSSASGTDRRIVRLAIRDLVSLGELTYTYIYGVSFLEKSFDKPVRISGRIVIKPPDKAYKAQPREIVVNIAAGAAFGNGAHPSTCLP